MPRLQRGFKLKAVRDRGVMGTQMSSRLTWEGVCQGDVHFDTRSPTDGTHMPSIATHLQDERFSACVKVYGRILVVVAP